MSVQIPLFEKTEANRSKVAAAVEEIVGEGFDVSKFASNFEVLSGAVGGIKHIRGLVLRRAVTTGFEGASGTWRSGALGDFASFLNGYAFKSEWFDPAGVRLVRNANVSHGRLDWMETVCLQRERVNEFNRFSLAEGDILVSLDRPIISTGVKVARVAASDLPCLLLQRVAKATGNVQDLDSSYLFLWLTSPVFTGAIDPGRSNGVPHISTKQIQALPMAVPPLAEQKRIVAGVDQLMARCDELEARQTKKRETGARLTKSALEALTTAEGPEEFDAACKRVVESFDVLIDRTEKVGELRKAVLDVAARGALWSVRGKKPRRTDGAFPIPTDWTWKSGNEVFSFITSGSRGWAQFYSDTGPIFLRIGNLDYGGIQLDLRNTQRVSPPANAEGTRTRVMPGDILVSITGDTGMVGLVPDELGEAYINQHIALCRPAVGVVPEFLARLLTAPSLLGRLQSAQRGIKNSLGLDDIRNLSIPVPPEEEQRAILRWLKQMAMLGDALEERLRQAEDRASKLVEAVVQELVA